LKGGFLQRKREEQINIRFASRLMKVEPKGGSRCLCGQNIGKKGRKRERCLASKQKKSE